MRLSPRDYEFVLKLLAELYAESDFDSFPDVSVSILRRAVPADRFSYNELSAEKNSARFLASPTFSGEEKIGKIFKRHFASHPVIAHSLKTGTLAAGTISDFWTMRQFRRTRLYEEYYRQLGINHQLTVFLNNSRRLQIGLACNRSWRGFSDRDKLMMNCLVPHFRQAYVNAHRVAEARNQVELLSRGLGSAGHGVICLTEAMTVRWMTRQAWEWLEKYFSDNPPVPRKLPDSLKAWLQQPPEKSSAKSPTAIAPLVVSQGNSRLMVRLIENSAGQSWLLLKEKGAGRLPEAALQPFDLTLREREILSWLVEGKNNPEIAIILGISPRTVEKHVERILEKLGVENRVAAIVLAQELRVEDWTI